MPERYAIRAQPRATPVAVSLVDQFGARTGTVAQAIQWCQAVSKNGEPDDRSRPLPVG